MVTEKGTATAIAADGEIPYRLTPNERSDYADLSGQNNAFGTIDYSFDPPWAFVGQQVSLAEIGLADAKPVQREARRVSATAMNCPNCGGALSLAAPDKTERVACPYCSSLLDVNQGNLRFLHALKPSPSPHEFVLPIGAEGTFTSETKYKIIGAVVRSVTIEDVQYFWHEYLLYDPLIGFRWLVHSDNHWNFVEPINAAEVVVSESSGKGSATYNGKSYKIFQDAPATVEYVKGEFYWRVEQGETARAIDYVAAPLMLSCEMSRNEINWSLGTYVPNAEIEKAFGVSGLPKPWSVAPNQPFNGSFYYTYGLIPLALLFVVALFMIPLSGFGSVPLNQQIFLPPLANAQTPQAAFSQPFDLKGNRNVRITANAPVNNSWADLDVDLINEQNNEVESVNIPVEYYSGSDSDGAWTEGAQSQDATLSALPAGKYTLRVEGTWQDWQQMMIINVKVEQNVNRGVNFFCALIVLLIVPLVSIFRKLVFESNRWKDSMFGSSG
jgi:DNA-directed RNA polymerase subunit RPC12/RpoP